MTLTLVRGEEPTGTFICTACGSTFPLRSELELHWDERPDCRSSLTRPIGQFDGPKDRNPCCPHCHERVGNPTGRPCPQHAYRGCPGC